MSPITEGIFITLAGGAVVALLGWIGKLLLSIISHLSKLPERVAALEAGAVKGNRINKIMLRGFLMMLDGQFTVVKCIENKSCNGDLQDLKDHADEFRTAIQEFLSDEATGPKK